MKARHRIALALCMIPALASARTITVGPSGRQFTQLRDVFASQDLAPGDVVLVDGGATYSSVVIDDDDSGTAQAPIVVRWSGVGATRPLISGGTHTVKFQQSDFVTLDGFEITGGSSTCVFNEAHGTVVRDAVIHQCPGHGILGADQNSGSFTLEYSEIYDAGAGSTKHPIYMQSDEIAHPGAVFLMRFNYIHDGKGGNLLKSRHERTQVYYNWFEGATYQEIELIGPDCLTQRAGWTSNTAREDADIVGNVFVHTSTWSNVARVGGDLNGRSAGRVRFVNNTFLIDRAGAARMVLVQLGLESLEMHNNAVYQPGANAPELVAENPAASVDTPECGSSREPWTAGRQVAGTYNWAESNASSVPIEWGVTRKGSDPGFTNVAARNLRPAPGSLLIDMGTHLPAPFAGHEQPGALQRPLFDPPLRRKLAVGAEHARLLFASNVDIGALEEIDSIDYLIERNCGGALTPPPSASSLVAASPAQRAPALAPAHAPPQRKPQPAPMTLWARLLRLLRGWFS